MNPSTHLAYVKSSRPTGKAMAKELGVSSFGITCPPIGELDVLIRWGSCKPMPRARYEINTPEAIMVASDKIAAFKAMQRDGVPTIPFYTSWDEAVRFAGNGSYIFGRSRRGYGGKDISIYLVGKDKPVKQHDFYTIWYDYPRELRLHVVEDKVVRIQGKYLDYPEKNDGGFIKNYEHGYRFRSPRMDLHPMRKKAAIDAVRACGLTFGAVDMLVGGGRNEQYVLEVNTAPACSPLTLRCYAGELALNILQATSGAVRLAPQLVNVEMEYDDEDEDY